MLNKGVDEILFNPDGKAWGIKTGNEVRAAVALVPSSLVLLSKLSYPYLSFISSLFLIIGLNSST